jgi:CTP:molybdopterin cytidylyltransferase MocA
MICVIPINNESRRLPGKCWRPLCGRPLVEWTLMTARCFFAPEDVWVVVRGSHPDCNKQLLHNYSDHVVREPMLGQPPSALNAVLCVPLAARADGVLLMQPTFVGRDLFDLEWFLRQPGGKIASSRDGHTNDGNVYIFRNTHESVQRVVYPHSEVGDPVTKPGVDINTLEDFNRAETLMAERLAKARV